MIRTILAVIFVTLAIVFVMPWLILWSYLVHSVELIYKVAMKALWTAVRLAGVRVHVEGEENIPPGVCMFAPNHVSNIDPLALLPAIPRRVGILMKKEIFRIPILSTAMRMARMVPVDRNDRESAAASAHAAVECLKSGLSFAIYPEGTRSHNGRLQRFKKGAFTIALRAGAPIVPVSIAGAQNVMRKGEWTIHPGEVTIRFGPAVDTSKYSENQRGELLARVEDLVNAGLPEDQKREKDG